MESTSGWSTQDELDAARARFEQALEGYVPPVAFGVGLAREQALGAQQATVFPVVNAGEHLLAAAVLATVCGYRHETITVELTPEQLARAIELLEPAEACTEVDHANLEGWRALHAAVSSGEEGRLVAVFVADFDDPASTEHDLLLRQQLAEQLA